MQSTALDIGTLFVIAITVTSLLGLFLLFAWTQERIPALAWWGVAYLIGGFSGALWRFGDLLGPRVPSWLADVLLFVAVGMIWSAARLFHSRPVLWPAMFFGAAFWLIACNSPAFVDSAASRILVSSLIVAGYTFMTATELWRERRKPLIRRWPAMFVPILHGAIFLMPAALATLTASGDAVRGPARGWIALLTIEIVLYVVGTAFIILTLTKDRAVRIYKMAAVTDPLTTLPNRRGFFEAAGALAQSAQRCKAPISVLAFDLDHFKSINDRFGHATGDTMLQLFASVVRTTMRADDIIGRLGGEEFVAILQGTATNAVAAAERVRAAFAAVSHKGGDGRVPATVSIGVASGAPTTAIETLIERADVALYRAKSGGRNRVEAAEDLEDHVTEQQHGGRREAGLLRRLVPFKAATAAAA
jgi:diguanylate cyclase (GGDEF)-like protein